MTDALGDSLVAFDFLLAVHIRFKDNAFLRWSAQKGQAGAFGALQ